MPDFGSRNQLEQAVNHSQPCPQNRDKRDLAPRNHVRFRDADRGLDLDLFDRHVAGRLIAHQHGDLVNQLAEFLRAGVLVPQEGDLVLDQRMVHNKRFQHHHYPLQLDFMWFRAFNGFQARQLCRSGAGGGRPQTRYVKRRRPARLPARRLPPVRQGRGRSRRCAYGCISR